MKIIINLINWISRAFSYTDDEKYFLKQNGKSNHIFQTR